MWADELSLDGREEIFRAVMGLNHQAAAVYVRMMLYIADFDWVPLDCNDLQYITGVTPRCFREEVWPHLNGIFRVYHGRLYLAAHLGESGPMTRSLLPPGKPVPIARSVPRLVRGGQS